MTLVVKGNRFMLNSMPKNDFISYDFDKNTTSHSQQHLKRNYDYMMVILQNLYRDDFTLDGFSV